MAVARRRGTETTRTTTSTTACSAWPDPLFLEEAERRVGALGEAQRGIDVTVRQTDVLVGGALRERRARRAAPEQRETTKRAWSTVAGGSGASRARDRQPVPPFGERVEVRVEQPLLAALSERRRRDAVREQHRDVGHAEPDAARRKVDEARGAAAASPAGSITFIALKSPCTSVAHASPGAGASCAATHGVHASSRAPSSARPTATPAAAARAPRRRTRP